MAFVVVEKENIPNEVEHYYMNLFHALHYTHSKPGNMICYDLGREGGVNHRYANFNAELNAIVRLHPGTPVCLVTAYLKGMRYNGKLGAGLTATTKRTVNFVRIIPGRDVFFKTTDAIWVVDACYDFSRTKMLRDQFAQCPVPYEKVVFFVNSEDRTSFLFNCP